MTEDFVAYWDVPELDPEDYGRKDFQSVKNNTVNFYETARTFQANNSNNYVQWEDLEDELEVEVTTIRGEDLDDVQPILDGEEQHIQSMDLQYFGEQAFMRLEYNAGKNPNYSLKVDSNTENRDQAELIFNRELRRTGFNHIKDFPRWLE